MDLVVELLMLVVVVVVVVMQVMVLGQLRRRGHNRGRLDGLMVCIVVGAIRVVVAVIVVDMMVIVVVVVVWRSLGSLHLLMSGGVMTAVVSVVWEFMMNLMHIVV